MCKFLYKILFHRHIALFGLIDYLHTFNPGIVRNKEDIALNSHFIVFYITYVSQID